MEDKMHQGVYGMTGSGPAVMIPPVEMPETNQAELMQTRFGEVQVYRQQPLIFTNGVLGMPDRNQFCLTHFPSPKMQRFKLLQSLEDSSLSFITLPVDLQNPIIERADLEHAARDLEIPLEQLAVLLVVSVHRGAEGVRLSVNARAPMLLHSSKRLAAQYVFPHTKYDIRKIITL
jgi:flagellar assembly factor FliW